jgi:hypothetical protein
MSARAPSSPAPAPSTGGKRAPWLSLLPALCLTLVAFAAGAIALYAPPATGEMAVVFAPGTDEASAYAAILAAGGLYVGPTQVPNIVVAYAADPDFSVRVQAQGGWFTLAASGLCTPLVPELI